jgi:hypothetical protein
MSAPFPYLPSKDADLSAWATNFSTLITATPTAYGLTAGQATTFSTAKSDFATKLETASNPSTRTKSTVAAKNTSRAALLVLIRSYMRIVQGFPSITPTQLSDLGLTVRKTTPTPIGAPVTSPRLTLLATSGQGIDFRFSDETTPDSRSRPFGTAGMELWGSVGTAAPAGPEATSFRGLYTKNTNGPGSRAARISFDSADVGKTAYLYARWIAPNGQVGPFSPLASMTVAA